MLSAADPALNKGEVMCKYAKSRGESGGITGLFSYKFFESFEA